MVRPRRCLWAFCLLLVTGAHALADAGAREPCPGTDGRYPVIEAGREGDVRGLFVPHVPGEPLGESHPGWIFREVAIQGDGVEARLEGSEVPPVRLVLRPRACGPDHPQVTASFLWSISGAGSQDATAAAMALLSAVKQNDKGGFYRVTVEPPPPPPPLAPASAERAVGKTSTAVTSQPRPPVPWNRTHLVLGILLLLALISLAVDAPGLRRDLGLVGLEARPAGVWLAVITVLGGFVRWFTPPTFMREAYPLPNVAYLLESVGWDQPISVYPQGQHVLTSFLSPILSTHPYDAWFQANVLLGALTIPAAFLLGTSVMGRRRAGLVGAALIAFWPQHIRLSASESTHVGFVLWATLALGLTAFAAKNGRFRTWAAALFAAGAALTMRPEAPLLIPALAVVALAHGDGVRRKLFRPGHLAALLLVAWLVVPWVLDIALDESAAAFSPDSSRGEAIGLHSLAMMAQVLLLPTADNAFFDPSTAPIWLYPMACWGFVCGLRSGPRGATLGLLVGLFSFMLLYSGMEVAVSIWGMGRYHLSALPFVLMGCTIGVLDLWTRVSTLSSRRQHLVPGTLGVAAVGAALWWPAVVAVPMDWQEELHWLIDLGRSPETEVGTDTRLVVPDNRRRFRDLSPRTPMLALSGGSRLESEAYTVAEALEELVLESDEPPTYYLEGLYCHLALGPGEQINPQCAAMGQAFVLEPLARHQIAGASFLTAYAGIRPPPPVEVTLYRVIERRLPPEETRDLLPDPWEPGRSPPQGFDVMGSPTDDSMAPERP